MTFSIITISYNSENTIRRTIESVLIQTCIDYEYIIVDGASSDHTLDIVKEMEPLFQGRMHWISEPDNGIYDAMNKGIRMSTGEIIGIVNSDDWLEVDALKDVSEVYSSNPANRSCIITGEMLFHYADGLIQHFPTSREKYEYYSKRFRMGLNHPATFVPKIVYDQIGLFDESFSLYADADFIVSCYEHNVEVCFVNKVLTNMSDGGASNKVSRKMLSDGLLKVRKHAKCKRQEMWMCLQVYISWLSKMIIPVSIVRIYRNLRKKK